MPPEAVDGMQLAHQGAVFLYGQGATKVCVFGSVAKGRRLDFRSDIDFAVEGLDPLKVLGIGAELENLLDFPVDLVEVERANPVLRAQIEAYAIFIPREN